MSDANPLASAGFVPPPLSESTSGYQPPSNPEHRIKESESKTARAIAITLISVLAGSVGLQYVTLSILVWRNHSDAVANFEHLFNAWLPVIAGLASSAVTFYLTKERK